jgi:3-oxoacyl-[acyl-carrier protein] reductase
MDLGLKGRVAVVGASTRGLGRASAEVLAAEGASVVVNGRSDDGVEAVLASIRAGGGTAVGLAADMTDPATPARLVDLAVTTYGRLDIVVGNNGGPPPSTPFEAEDDAILAAVEANQLASIRLARAALPHLRANGWGRICLITSSGVRQPMGFLATSGMARAGLWSWAKMAAREVAEEGITVNLICPGGHATDRLQGVGGQVRGRMGDPVDFGKAVAFLCSEPATFVNGIAFGIDGGSVLGML